MQGHVRSSSELFKLSEARNDVHMPAPAPVDSSSSSEEASDGVVAVAALAKVKAKAKAKGRSKKKEGDKIDLKKLRQAARTTLMWILDCLCSKYLHSMCNLLVDVVNPRNREHARYCIVAQGGAQRIRRMYGYLACGSWKTGVCRTFAVLSDLSALSRASMNVDCGELQEHEYDPEQVVADNLFAEEAGSMVLGQAEFGTLEGMHLQWGFPHCLAGLTLTGPLADAFQPALKKKIYLSLAAFKWNRDEADARTHPVMLELLETSFWKTGFGQFLRCILENGNDSDFTVLCLYLCLLWSGHGIAKVLEVANGAVRQYLNHNTQGKFAALDTLWGLARQQGVAGHFSRQEVRPESTVASFLGGLKSIVNMFDTPAPACRASLGFKQASHGFPV